ncbi:MAG TPA: NADH:ubiquinone oxidoreductase subunit NDUFA12 [Micavibrio sp.]
MGLFSFLGVLSPVHMAFTRIMTGAHYIGTDTAGNRYYEAKPIKGYKRPRRFVRYKHSTEASNIPPEWHGWMHHQTNVVPTGTTQSHRRAWQKPHIPNQTGTAEAYRPPGHVLSGGKRAKATGDYEAWTPPQ